jgi:hypothetical protein
MIDKDEVEGLLKLHPSEAPNRYQRLNTRLLWGIYERLGQLVPEIEIELSSMPKHKKKKKKKK